MAFSLRVLLIAAAASSALAFPLTATPTSPSHTFCGCHNDCTLGLLPLDPEITTCSDWCGTSIPLHPFNPPLLPPPRPKVRLRQQPPQPLRTLPQTLPRNRLPATQNQQRPWPAHPKSQTRPTRHNHKPRPKSHHHPPPLHLPHKPPGHHLPLHPNPNPQPHPNPPSHPQPRRRPRRSLLDHFPHPSHAGGWFCHGPGCA